MRRTRVARLFYFDEEGIRDLLGQTGARELVSSKEKTEGSGSIEIGAKASLKGLFSQVLGLDIEASGTTKGGITKGHEGTFEKYRTSIIHDLVEALEKVETPIHPRLAEAALYATQNAEMDSFFFGDLRLDIPEFSSTDGILAAQQTGAIQWQKHFGRNAIERKFDTLPTLLSLDDPRRIPLVMSMSTNKLQERIGPTGHLALFIRGHGATDVPLTVLASVRRTRFFYQLKAYAAWF